MMRSKKAKKRKVKCKRIMRLSKLHRVKESAHEFSPKKKNCLYKTNSLKTNEYRSSIDRYDGPRVKKFAQMREYYFKHLQTVVSENCSLCGSLPSIDALKNLSLELEQEALLASLQADIYIEALTKIIIDIQKCTQENQIHSEVKKLLQQPNSNEDFLEDSNESLNIKMSPSQVTPTKISSPVVNSSVIGSSQEDAGIPEYFSDVADQGFTVSDQNAIQFSDTESWSQPNSNLNFCSNLKSEITDVSFIGLEQNSTPPNSAGVDIEIESTNIINHKQSSVESSKCHSFTLSPTQPQESIEQKSDSGEQILRQKNEERERSYIAQILEGNEDTSEEQLNSFSENKTELKENINDSNLLNRLEKMREIFGVESCFDTNAKSQTSSKENKLNSRNRKPTIWKHEKIIQQYKFAMLSSEMTVARQIINKRLFIKLFGEDSDDEHEVEYKSLDRYKASCAERISSWVVKYLMPYYHDKRIIGRQIFKSLGHHICNMIIGKIHYPDEWTVKYFVSKFFPERKKYVCDADIFAFEYI